MKGLSAPSFIADCLDGWLTGLDRLVAEIPEAEAMVVARAAEWDLLADGVVRALASYPFRPAPWLTKVDFAPPGQPEIDLLARAVVGVVEEQTVDRPVESAAKLVERSGSPVRPCCLTSWQHQVK